MAQTLLVSIRDRAAELSDTLVVRTMLDMITRLENASGMINKVVLGAEYAQDRCVEEFLRETYPRLAISVAGDH